MKKKIFAISMMTMALILVPGFVLAEAGNISPKPTGDKPVKVNINNQKAPGREFATTTKERRELGTTTREGKEKGTSTKEGVFNQIKNQAGVYIEVILSHLDKSINRLTNVISRLEGPNSIIVKLDNNGKNTTAIKAKLAEAKTSLSQAKAEIASTTTKTKELLIKATTTQAINSELKKGFGTLKTSYKSINSKIRAAQVKITEALRLIKETPGINKIDKGNVASTTAASTN